MKANEKIYYSVKMKHKEKGFVIRHDCFGIKPQSSILVEVTKIVPKELRDDDWEVDIKSIDKSW